MIGFNDDDKIDSVGDSKEGVWKKDTPITGKNSKIQNHLMNLFDLSRFSCLDFFVTMCPLVLNVHPIQGLLLVHIFIHVSCTQIYSSFDVTCLGIT